MHQCQSTVLRSTHALGAQCWRHASRTPSIADIASLVDSNLVARSPITPRTICACPAGASEACPRPPPPGPPSPTVRPTLVSAPRLCLDDWRCLALMALGVLDAHRGGQVLRLQRCPKPALQAQYDEGHGVDRLQRRWLWVRTQSKLDHAEGWGGRLRAISNEDDGPIRLDEDAASHACMPLIPMQSLGLKLDLRRRQHSHATRSSSRPCVLSLQFFPGMLRLQLACSHTQLAGEGEMNFLFENSLGIPKYSTPCGAVPGAGRHWTTTCKYSTTRTKPPTARGVRARSTVAS
jgi:hypothetical protein